MAHCLSAFSQAFCGLYIMTVDKINGSLEALSLPSSILVGEEAPETGPYEHASKHNTGEHALMLGRDAPLLPHQRPEERQQHELHGVGEPARSGVHKNKRLEPPEPYGRQRIVRGVRLHAS